MAETKRRTIISGNWKMHHNHFEAIQAVQKLWFRLQDDDFVDGDVTVHPPFTDLRSVQTVIETDRMKLTLGAQNCHWEERGAFTGEVAPSMLAKLNVTYTIVGHSERRELFGETDEIVAKKVKAILAAGMTPILCVGETLAEREAGGAKDKVSVQIQVGLDGLTAEQVGGLVVAYEPIWAIGTGKTATSDDAQSMCGDIRTAVSALHGDSAATSLRVQYGGSVKPANIAELMAQPDIDGALVGGASLDPDEFARIVQYRETRA